MDGKRVIFMVSFTSLLMVLPLLSLGVSADTSPKQWQPAAAQAAPTGTSTYLPVIEKNYQRPPAISPLWRFGIARARRPISDYNPTDVASMRFGWYVDWGAGSSPLSVFGMEYMPMVRVKQVKLNGSMPTTSPCAGCPYATPFTFTMSLTITQIQTIAANQPGATWVVGNEIERRDWGTCGGCGQDEIVPELYAVAYHDAYAMIKQADPTAQVAIGGMIQATPLRLAYLQRVWDAYQSAYGAPMQVDVWNIHAFVLNEVSCAYDPNNCWGAGIPAGMTENSGLLITPEQNKDFTIAQGHIVALRTWMQQHGQRDKPLIITEYGVNIPEWWGCPGTCPFTADQVRDSYMYPSFNYFLNTTNDTFGFPADGNRLVQRWNWYSFDDDALQPDSRQGFNGNLFSSGLNAGHPMGIVPLGTYWKQYVQPLPPGATKPY